MNFTDQHSIALLHHLASLRGSIRSPKSIEPFDPANPHRIAFQHNGRRWVVDLSKCSPGCEPSIRVRCHSELVPSTPVPDLKVLRDTARRKFGGGVHSDVWVVEDAEELTELGFGDDFVVATDLTYRLGSEPLRLDDVVQTCSFERSEFERIAQWQSGVTDYGDFVTESVGRRDGSWTADEPSTTFHADEDDGNEFLSSANDRVIENSSRPVDAILGELDRLIGLEPVKKQVRRLVRSQQVAAERKRRGLPAAEVSPHLVFLGNPGTGKTTVARLVGEVYRAIGLLERGHVVETDRAGLVGAYIGTTAIKTRRVCKSALGGVLFVDEAYMLNPNGVDRDYGPEAIATLLAFMENNRGRIAVVAAGYPAEMEAFLRVNPGLASRFDISVNFPDYAAGELSDIFDLMMGEHGMVLTPGAREAVDRVLVGWKAAGRPNFANGREVRNLVQEILRRHAEVLGEAGGLEALSDEQLSTIDVGAVPVDEAGLSALLNSSAGYV